MVRAGTRVARIVHCYAYMLPALGTRFYAMGMRLNAILMPGMRRCAPCVHFYGSYAYRAHNQHVPTPPAPLEISSLLLGPVPPLQG